RNAGRELFGLPLLDEGGGTPAASGQPAGAQPGGSQGGEAATGGDGGSALGTVVLTLGLVGGGAGVLVAALAGATAGFSEAALGFPAIPVPADAKLLLRPVGIVALVGVAAGIVVLGGGGVLTTVGLFVE